MHLFISDVHIGAFDQAKESELSDELQSLIRWCQKERIKLHVLGDLFDYWMEHRDYIPPLGSEILSCFKSYHEAVGSTFYITGNHDYWTSGHFKDCGFTVFTDPVTISLDKKMILLFHGDGAGSLGKEFRRPLLHRILRHSAFVELYKTILSGEQANLIMKKFSTFTRDPLDVNPEKLNRWACRLLQTRAEDAMIAGHDHVARAETFYGKTYINCGAFHTDKTLARYKNGTFDLVMWNSGNRQLEKINQSLGRG